MNPRGDVHFYVALLAVGACGFGLIAHGLVFGQWLPAFDTAVAGWIASHRDAGFGAVVALITHAHGTVAVSLWALVLVVAFTVRGERSWAWTAAVAVWGGLIINALIKQAFARPRPEHGEIVRELTTYSFPSGHTAGAAVLYGIIAGYVAYRFEYLHVRLAALLAWLALVLLVGYSRVYLGVHYPSDVLAAAAWSAGWVALCLRARASGSAGRWPRRAQ